jgi:hypothetical protein
MRTRLRAGWSGVRISTVGRDFSRLRNVQTISGARSASYSFGTVVLSRGKVAGCEVYHSRPPRVRRYE